MTANETIRQALAAAAGEHGTEAHFPWCDLVVIVWRADKKRWGMRGYDLPDTKRICSDVSKAVRSGAIAFVDRGSIGGPGNRGLNPRRQAVYRLTEKGKA